MITNHNADSISIVSNTFYMYNVGAFGNDIKLKSKDWDSAIYEVKNTHNYYAATLAPRSWRLERGIDDHVEVYRGKLRHELTLEDLRDENIFRKTY